MPDAPKAHVIAVARDNGHHFSKHPQDRITLLAGLGVQGDAHAGVKVQHLSRMARDPTQPNLRQVHLIQSELFGSVARHGLTVTPGQMGENITTAGIDLLALPTGTILRLGAAASIQITGLRNPCAQIEAFQPGLLARVLDRTTDGLIRKAGVMAIVLTGGDIRPGDPITITLPALPHHPLVPV
jgi:MOSC domain-containing protein YiiM